MRERIAQVLAGVVAVLLVLCVANPDHFQPWTSFHSEAPAFVGAALLLAAVALRRRPALPGGVLLLGALVAVAWLQWLAGLVRHAGDAWVVTAYLLAFGAAWWWAAADPGSWPTQRPLDLIAGVLVVMGLLDMLQLLLQWVQAAQAYPGWISDSLEPRRSTGNFNQPNQSATLLMMATVAVGWWAVRGRIGRISLWVWLVAAGWSLVLTQSRTALLSAAVLAASLGLLSIWRPVLRQWALHAAAWFLVLLVFTWIVQTVPFEFARLALGMEAMGSPGLRHILWKQMLAALAQQPLAGYGWLQVQSAQQVGALQVPGTEQVTYAHNLELDLLVMLGVPLALLVFGIAAAWALRRLQRLRDDDGTATAALFMLLPLLVHSQLELPHAYSYFLVPAGILLGVFDAHTRATGTTGWRVHPAATGLAAAAMAVLLGLLAYDYTQVEQDFRVNRFANRNIGEVPRDYVPPSLPFLSQFSDLLQAMRSRAAPGMPAADLDALSSAARRYTWAPLHFRAALAQALNGHPDIARYHLRVIQNLFPPAVSAEGRESWERLAREQYPELRAVPWP